MIATPLFNTFNAIFNAVLICSFTEYDSRGNCLSEAAPLGGAREYAYDELNRLTLARGADGGETRLTYNAYEDIVKISDKLGSVEYEYDPLGGVLAVARNGAAVKYGYDNEGRLVSITNEKGEEYRLEYDSKGYVVKETGYDGLGLEYGRDKSGLVTRITRPGGRWASYSRGGLGEITRADYYDGSWETYEYDKNGALIAAANQDSELRLERDSVGRVTKEWQNGEWALAEYGAAGNRVKTRSGLGA